MPGAARRPPLLWPWALLLGLSLGVSGLILWSLWPTFSLPFSGTFRPVPAVPSPQPMGGEPRRVRLFFPQGGGGTLREVEREVAARPGLADQVREVLRALAAGGPGVQSPLPIGAQVRRLFLDDFGILYLDFSPEIRAIATAPDGQPELAISALVTTLTTDFNEVKRVRLLADGQELDEVVGGVELRRPIGPRFPGEGGTPDTARPGPSAP